MFDYVFRAQKLGWAVVVADPHGDCDWGEHLPTLWSELLQPLPFSQLLVVGHSAGASMSMDLLQRCPDAQQKLAALALTDGAFAPPQGAGAAAIKARTRNFKAAETPAGTPMASTGGICNVSAGHPQHPATTHAATEPLFAFLCESTVAGSPGQATSTVE